VHAEALLEVSRVLLSLTILSQLVDTYIGSRLLQYENFNGIGHIIGRDVTIVGSSRHKVL